MQQDRSLCRCVAGVNTTSGRECEGVGHQNSTLPEPAPLAKAFPVVVATFPRWWEILCVHVRAGVGRGSGVAAVQVCLECFQHVKMLARQITYACRPSRPADTSRRTWTSCLRWCFCWGAWNWLSWMSLSGRRQGARGGGERMMLR